MKNFRTFLTEAGAPQDSKNPHLSPAWRTGTLHKKIDVFHKGKYHHSTNAYTSCKNAKAGHLYHETDHDPKDVKAVYSESLEEGGPNDRDDLPPTLGVLDKIKRNNDHKTSQAKLDREHHLKKLSGQYGGYKNESLDEMVKVKQGDKVELHHHVSSGEAHGHTGKIVKVGSVDHRTTIATDPKNLHHIKMDKSGEVLKVHPGNVKNITESLDEEFEGKHYKTEHDRMGHVTITHKASGKSVYLQGDEATHHRREMNRMKTNKVSHEKIDHHLSQYDDVMESLQEAKKDWQTGKTENALRTHTKLHKETGEMLKKIVAHHKANHPSSSSDWGNVGDAGRTHAQVKEIHDQLYHKGEYAKDAK